jgi:hypothetical protein
MKITGNPIIIIIFGLIFLAVGSWMAYSDYVATTWNVIQGDITHSTVGVEYDYSDEDIDHFADIKYEYQFQGQKYSGSCCKWRSDKFIVQGFVDKYIAGSESELYVNPQAPNESRLKDDVNPFGWFNLIFIALGLLIVLAGAIQLFKGMQAKEKIG